MTETIWDVLAIPPTTDPAAIRRAYAIRLKQRRPEEDTDAFVRLRAAYEAALRRAAEPPEPAAPEPGAPAPAEAEAAPIAPPPPAMPTPLEPPAAEPSALVVAALAINQGDVREAAALLLTVRGDQTIPLGPAMRMTDFLAARLAQDPAIDDATVEAIAHDLGWLAQPPQSTSPAIAAVRQRIAAARWIGGVRADARRLTRFIGNDHAAACAMLVGRGGLVISRLMAPLPQLQVLLRGLHVHGAWAERALDAPRVAALRALVGRDGAEQARRLDAFALVGAAFFVVGLIFDVPSQMVFAFFAGLVAWRLPFPLLRRYAFAGVLSAIVLAVLDQTAPVDGNVWALIGFCLIGGFLVALFVMSLLRRVRRRQPPVTSGLVTWLASLAVAAVTYALVNLLRGDDQYGHMAALFAYFAALILLRRSDLLRRLRTRGGRSLHTEVIQPRR